MTPDQAKLTTGLPGLDRVLRGLSLGDNVVFQIEDVEDYHAFVEPYVAAAIRQERTLVYFRFARHRPLLTEESSSVRIVELHPQQGFEVFITEVRQVIKEAGRGAFYVFDCLSDLTTDWLSDEMLGNFFMLTCPYLYDMETVAYFGLKRNLHSLQAVQRIADTTQLLLDVYRHDDKIYLHPLKVQQRYSPTMHMLHEWVRDTVDETADQTIGKKKLDTSKFIPVTRSAEISEILTGVPWPQLDSLNFRLGIWNHTFLEAIEVTDPLQHSVCDITRVAQLRDRLQAMAITRDERMQKLIERYMSLDDILDIGKRIVGTGLIGGKSVGMLLARAILTHTDSRWNELLESHDSFYIASDVFYTFLVRNGIWWVRERQRNPEAFLDDAATARQRMLTGSFPDYIEKQFTRMLEYFGQSPFIVRSSSLLEDNFGNAFAGKYDSIFCVNQGPRHQRATDYLSAVRAIYASSMSEKALRYRAGRGLLDRDEQMALLVQRVSGSVRRDKFFPDVAGVALSFNPYVWNENIDPAAGMLRLVYGLGTRAVDRSDDDYTRVVSLSAPDRRPEHDFDEMRRYAQRRVDLLDLEGNRLMSEDFASLIGDQPDPHLSLFASRDEEMVRRAEERGITARAPWVLTFDQLLMETNFVTDMKDMLHILEDAYEHPVDVEFTTNFLPDGRYKINLVQCRPLQVKDGGNITDPPSDIKPERIALEARGAVIGPSAITEVDRVIYVTPSVYGQLPVNERYQVARLIGEIVNQQAKESPRITLLLGPGRWGTTTPSLGVPVTFADINGVSAVCEIVAMRDDLIPDVSLGTHFLSELIEADMLYMALFPTRDGNFLNREFFETIPNRLTQVVPGSEQWAHVVRVFDREDLPEGQTLKLHANTMKQRVVCYLE